MIWMDNFWCNGRYVSKKIMNGKILGEVWGSELGLYKLRNILVDWIYFRLLIKYSLLLLNPMNI